MTRTGARVRAPELTGRGGWLNSDRPLSLAELRGRVVVLDFWTSGCANCLHVIDELRELERSHRDTVVVVGVHSPKFAHEAGRDAVAAAVGRHQVDHPVLSDPDLHLWQQYAVHAWPTLVVIDPEGYVVAQAAGEGQVAGLARIIDELIEAHAAKGTLRRGAVGRAPVAETGALRFPAKALALPGGHLLVADSGGHDLVEIDADGQPVRRIGSGRRGRLDGPADVAEFAEPNGLAFVPGADYDVLVADTANHVLRGVRLADGAVVATVELSVALAGRRTVTGPVPGVLSPWDVAWWPAIGRVVIAAAGVHLLLALEPATGAVDILAGTTVEGLRDGPALDAWLAQPSGLAVDGDTLWFADAETSALRRLSTDGQVTTVVGEGLFDFGHLDGPAAQARLQHPLDVALAPDGRVLVADTYNGALRAYDPGTGEVSTVASGLAEPTGVTVSGDRVAVVESAAHRIVLLPTDAAPAVAGRTAGSVQRPAGPVQRPTTRLAPGPVELTVRFTAPPGQKLDDSDGPSTRLTVSASPAGLLREGAGEGTDLVRRLVLNAQGGGVLHISATAASCDDDPRVEHPACHLGRQDWGIPVEIRPDGPDTLDLVLLG